MSNINAHATSVIHFSRLYGSIQLYLECTAGDLFQDYTDGFTGCNPDYTNWVNVNSERARIIPLLLQQSGSDNEISAVTWKVGNVTLEFDTQSVTGDATLFPCKDATGFKGVFARRVLNDGECLEVVGNFAAALNGQSTMLTCEVTIVNGGAEVAKARAALPITCRVVSGNDYSIHIQPSGGKELGIQPDTDKKELLCYPYAAISKGVTPITSMSGHKVVWEYFDGTAWIAVPATVYSVGSDATAVTTPMMKKAGEWWAIVVPCGAVDSQLLIRAKLYNTENPSTTSAPVATDTATIYDNSDTVYINPNPDREETFQVGNPELETPIVYTPKVMKGESDLTADYKLAFKLLGSAGEVMTGKGTHDAAAGTFTVKLADVKQAACDVTLSITATHI